jgi:hypothetical protein
MPAFTYTTLNAKMAMLGDATNAKIAANYERALRGKTRDQQFAVMKHYHGRYGSTIGSHRAAINRFVNTHPDHTYIPDVWSEYDERLKRSVFHTVVRSTFVPPARLEGTFMLKYRMYLTESGPDSVVIRRIPAMITNGRITRLNRDQYEKVKLILKAQQSPNFKYRITFADVDEGHGSDSDLIADAEYTIQFISATPIVPVNRRHRFWRYFVKPEAVDRVCSNKFFKFYKSVIDHPVVKQTCFFDVLDDYGIKDADAIMPKTKAVASKHLTSFANELDLKIKLYNCDHTYENQKNIPSTTYGNGSQLVTIAHKNNHYFSLKKRGSLAYLNRLDMNDFIAMTDEEVAYLKSQLSAAKRLDTLEGLTDDDIRKSYILEEDVADHASEHAPREYYEDGYDNDDAFFMNDAFMDEDHIESEEKSSVEYFVFDFECIVTEGNHLPYCMYVKSFNQGVAEPSTWPREAGPSQSIAKTLYGGNILKRFHDWLKANVHTDVVMYAHNAGRYDAVFFKTCDQFLKTEEVNINGAILALKMKFKGSDNKWHKLEIRDSLRMISMPLKEFSKMLKIPDFDMKKGIYPYKFYNSNTLKTICSVRDIPTEGSFNAEDYIRNEGSEVFDAKAYCIKYCRQDVNILIKGLELFAQTFKSLYNADMYKSLTISSLAQKIMLDNLAYKNIPQIKAGTRVSNFIRRSLKGGRTMVGFNDRFVHPKYASLMRKVGTKYELTDKEYDAAITDFDAVALYPSAMVRARYPAGHIHRLTDFDAILASDKAFYAALRITTHTPRNFPMTVETRDGASNFSNEEVINVVDNNTFADLIKLQDITYEFIEGLYFDSWSVAHQDIIHRMSEDRARLKREGNPAQEVVKLLMNSVYGKSILNHDKLKTIKYVQSEEKLKSLVINNTWAIHDITDCGFMQRIVVKHKPKKGGYDSNYLTVGLSVLSMSKTIMREVMELADDKIMYQDTDSMHISVKDLNALDAKFKKLYRRDLIGASLGQFHSDFEVKIDDKKYSKCGSKPVISIKTVILGKKCYCDELLYNDDEGILRVGHHMRIKGVTRSVITPDIYDRIYNGNKIAIDLVTDSNAVFKVNQSCGTVISLPTFTRAISKNNGHCWLPPWEFEARDNMQ